MQGGKNAENSRRKIFIGGLPSNVTENQLKDYFSRYGQVCLRFHSVLTFFCVETYITSFCCYVVISGSSELMHCSDCSMLDTVDF